VLSYVVAILVFLPGAIAGLQFTVDGGGESRKNISKIDKTVKSIQMAKLKVPYTRRSDFSGLKSYM